MSCITLQHDLSADTQSSNAAPETLHHDASGTGNGTAVPDGMARPGAKSSMQTASNRSGSTVQVPPPNSNNSQHETSVGAHALAGHLNRIYEASLQIPGRNPPAEPLQPLRRTVESSQWDWNTSLDSLGESSSYYYEPQGELLRLSNEDRPVPSRTEFTIPTAVSDPADWLRNELATPNPINSGFAIPRKPSGLPSQVAGVKRKAASDRESAMQGREPDQERSSQNMTEVSEDAGSPAEERPPAQSTRSQRGLPSVRGRSATDTSEVRSRPPGSDFETSRPGGAPTAGLRRTLTDPATPMVLPARKVFPIQIGDKLFRLSGASISSDGEISLPFAGSAGSMQQLTFTAPSYFSQFFEEQLRQSEGADSVRTLYIDRDPATFEDIALHLQGYHVEPRDGPHFVKLFADAQFYSLPRLTAQLFASTIYIRIGDSEFQIPRDLFTNPGDSPNYFSLGFSIFFTTPNEVFPGLTQRTLLRPPSILPPSVPNRSAKTFADLLHILKGYPVEIRNDEHRQELLRDARYFHLKGLEQRLIPHQISYNLARKRTEILVRLEDIRQSGISFVADSLSTSSSSAATSPASNPNTSTPNAPGWIYYQRPYVDSEAYSLLVEISGDEAMHLSIAPGSPSAPRRVGRAMFYRQALSRITSLFSVIANKMNLPATQPLGLMMMERGAGVASLPVSPGNTGLSEDRVKVRIGADADVSVDGRKWFVGEEDEDDEEQSGMDVDSADYTGRKRRRVDEEEDEGEEWIVRKSQWRLRIQAIAGGVQPGRSGMEVILGAVKIEAVSSERGRNVERAFLS